jgi:hypothetical protein
MRVRVADVHEQNHLTADYADDADKKAILKFNP